MFFLGRLLRVEERAGFTILVSSCEYARELAAPPAMLQGRTIFVRMESARRYLWEKIEEWQWRKQDNAMKRAHRRLRLHLRHRGGAAAHGGQRGGKHDPARGRRGDGRRAPGRRLARRGDVGGAHSRRARRPGGARPARRLPLDAAGARRARQPSGAALPFRHLRCPAPSALSRGAGGLRGNPARRGPGVPRAGRARRRRALARDRTGIAGARWARSRVRAAGAAPARSAAGRARACPR